MDFLWALYRDYMLNIRRDAYFAKHEEGYKASFVASIGLPEKDWYMESMLFWVRQLHNQPHPGAVKVKE